MTYRQLENLLKSIPEDHKDDDVSVLLMQQGEVFEAIDLAFVGDSTGELTGQDQVAGVLDDGHPYITVDA